MAKTTKAAPAKAAPAKKAAPKNTSKAEAQQKASSVDDTNQLKELIVKEACMLTKGASINMNELMALCAQLMKRKDPTQN